MDVIRKSVWGGEGREVLSLPRGMLATSSLLQRIERYHCIATDCDDIPVCPWPQVQMWDVDVDVDVARDQRVAGSSQVLAATMLT